MIHLSVLSILDKPISLFFLSLILLHCKACASLEEGYLPPVTFVVVQKRHHTRLFPEVHGRRDMTDKSGNILPGQCSCWLLLRTYVCYFFRHLIIGYIVVICFFLVLQELSRTARFAILQSSISTCVAMLAYR